MLEELRQKRVALSNKIKELLDRVASEKRALSKEEREEHDRLEVEFDEVEDTIKRFEKQESRSASLSSQATRQASKSVQVEVIRNEHEDENGDIHVYREFAKGGFGEMLRDVARFERTRTMPEKLGKLQKWAAAGASEGVGVDGGFLTQPDHVAGLFGMMLEEAQLAPKCRRIQTDSPEVVLRLIDETSRATGSRFGGAQAFRRAEADQVTGTKPKFRRENIKADAMDALFYATDELLEDVSGLQSLVAPMFAAELAWLLDDEIIGGTGSGGQCLGILNSPATIVIAKESGQSADTIVYENLDNMEDRLIARSDGRAQYFYAQSARKQLRNMVHAPGSNTDFLPFVPGNGGIGAEKFDTLMGRPATRVEQARALGDKGDIILADLNEFLLVERRGLLASQSAHVRFLTSEMTFKWSQRVGGQPMPNSPITDAYGIVTRSPFLVIADRA